MGLRQKWKCGTCQKRLTDLVDVDHVIPRAQGGGDALENLQLLCVMCHARKTRREARERKPKAARL